MNEFLNPFPDGEPKKSDGAQILLVNPMYNSLQEVNRKLQIPTQQLIARQLVFLNWVTGNVSEHRNIYRFDENSHMPLRIESPVIEAARTGFVDDKWIIRTMRYIDNLRESELGFPIGLREPITTFMHRIADRTGIESSEVLFNHGAGVFNEVFREDPYGVVVAAVDLTDPSDRKYQLWSMDADDPFGPRLWGIEQRIDEFDDYVIREVPAPL